MLLFFALNLVIISFINSNESEKTFLLYLEIQQLYQKANITSENLNLLNYNKTSIQEEKHKEIILKSQAVKAGLPIRNFISENEEIKNSETYVSQNNLNFLSLPSKTSKITNFPNKSRLLQGIICINSTLSCSGHGECNQAKTDCVCESGYTFFEDPKEQAKDNQRCNYERKKQLKAFLFELFLGFGAGHFYTERYTKASLKLSAFIFGIFIICMFPITAKFLSEKLESDCLVLSVSCFYYLCSIGLAFWFIYGLVMFGMNKNLDGNQIQLQSWSKNPDS